MRQDTNHVIIWSPSKGRRKPQREKHQALAVAGERHLSCGQGSKSGHSSEWSKDYPWPHQKCLKSP